MSKQSVLFTSASAIVSATEALSGAVTSTFFLACATTTSTPPSRTNQSRVALRMRPGRVVHEPDVVAPSTVRSHGVDDPLNHKRADSAGGCAHAVAASTRGVGTT